MPTATTKYLKNRRVAFWAVAGSALIFVACSSTDSGERSGVTSTQVPQGTLPGESLQDAGERVFRSCLDTLGVPYEVHGPYQISYHATPDLSVDEINAICEAEAQEAGLIEDRPRTAEEITSGHQRLAKWSECVRSVGYDPGPLISLEEYLASGGISNPLPGIDVMMGSLRSEAAWKQLEIDCPQ